MLHFIWYIIVGLIAGFVAKSVMHMHMTLLWTVVVGIVGGCVTHLFSRPKGGVLRSKKTKRLAASTVSMRQALNC
jgi:uncharacterized membrane protein YeaQ/YmgE (transglycosylase-associated protein family)